MKIKFKPTQPEAKLFPPRPVKMDLPKWYKEMGNTIGDLEVNAKNLVDLQSKTLFTIKRCVPVQDYMLSGYSIIFPYDVMFSIRRDEKGAEVKFFTPTHGDKKVIGKHTPAQFPMMRNGIQTWITKFFAGWVINTPPGYSCLLYPNFYQFEERVTFLPAIVDTDTFDSEIGFIGYVDCSQTMDFKIEAGTPIMNVFPFKRDEWDMEIQDEVFDEKKHSKSTLLGNQLIENMYRRFFHSKKRYD